MKGDGTKIAPTGDIFDEPPSEMSWIRGKLTDHVGDHVVLSPEGAVLVTSPGTESSYPRPPHSLNDSSHDSILVPLLGRGVFTAGFAPAMPYTVCVCVCVCVYL